MKKKLWIVLSQSCTACNRTVVGVYDHQPTEEEERNAVEEGAVLTCSTTKIIEAKINGIVELEN